MAVRVAVAAGVAVGLVGADPAHVLVAVLVAPAVPRLRGRCNLIFHMCLWAIFVCVCVCVCVCVFVCVCVCVCGRVCVCVVAA